jgi:hypothetical protein
MFLSRKQTPQGSQTRLYVETREAMVGMTVAYNDKPLTSEQLKGHEENRLGGAWLSNPEQLRHKHSQEQENAEHTLRIVKALPECFSLRATTVNDGRLRSLGPAPGVRLVRLKFRPNPAYQPPSHVELVLVGHARIVVIDPVGAEESQKSTGLCSKRLALAGEFSGISIRVDTFLCNSAMRGMIRGKFPACP